MDEKQIVSPTSQSLVLQTEREKMFFKLRDMRLNNLTAKQQKNLNESCNRFVGCFVSLSYSFFGLSKDQLKEFSESELKELSELISHKARPWAICQILFSLFTLGVPLAGWIVLAFCLEENLFGSLFYLYHRKYLKKSYGKDYFPLEKLNKILRLR